MLLGFPLAELIRFVANCGLGQTQKGNTSDIPTLTSKVCAFRLAYSTLVSVKKNKNKSANISVIAIDGS